MLANIEILKTHPDWNFSIEIIQTLTQQGYIAYLAGGCVRDLILSRVPHDLDIATSAQPDQVEQLFAKTVAVGKAFGVIRVLNPQSPHQEIEVATFREDGVYTDGRRPEMVSFSSAEKDAQRRDLTINALFFDPLKIEIIDYVDGQKDIQKKLIRTVGQPEARFKEDHLRILRAVRFAAELEFDIEETTAQAIRSLVPSLKTVSRERIQEELKKIWLGSHPKQGLIDLQNYGLLAVIDFLVAQRFEQIDLQGFSEFDHELQRWVLFFEPLSRAELRENYKNYRFSNEQQKSLNKMRDFLTLDYSQMSMGFCLSLWPELEFQEILPILKKRKLYSDLWVKIESHVLPDWRQNWPVPILAGADIPVEVPAQKRGVFLKRAYEMQLEFRFKSKDDFKDWILLIKQQGVGE